MNLSIKLAFLYTVIFWYSMAFSSEKPNILFIAVDDLNCDFNAYGNNIVKSPNLDKLAQSGTLFGNNHCAQAVCGASRASLLTGQLPHKTGVQSFYTYFRDLYPDMLTIPLFFKQKGYNVEGVGKIHDSRNVSEFNGDDYDKISWTSWRNISGSKRYVASTGKPATEMVDVADNTYNDGKYADIAIDRIQELAKESTPFFFAVGFQKPHLPFTAPKKYWDLYKQSEIPLAEFTENAANDFDDFYNRGGELRGYDNMPEEGDIPQDTQRELIHGYYACVSFIDAQIGRIINTLKATGKYDNTIIVFWGDHGWHLGDHNMWTKHTNFERATRSPLIIKAPNMPSNQSTNSPTGHIDIFPTLVHLSGYDIPSELNGRSLKGILEDENAHANPFVVSRFKRGGYDGNALRNKRYRFVEWDKNGDKRYQLFDYLTDPNETVNLAYKDEFKPLISDLSQQLSEYLSKVKNGEPLGHEVPNNDMFNIHPNPANNVLNFSGIGEILKVEVFDLKGNRKLVSNSKATYIRIDDLEQGFYIVSIDTPEKKHTRLVLKR